jgi:hypothetical protein
MHVAHVSGDLQQLFMEGFGPDVGEDIEFADDIFAGAGLAGSRFTGA